MCAMLLLLLGVAAGQTLQAPRQLKGQPSKESKPHIQELTVKTTILSRYAFTTVSCTMFNRHPALSETVFQMHIPSTAYVSNFTMMIGGRSYSTEIQPKMKKARRMKDGRSQGQSGERAKHSERDMEIFNVTVSVPGRNRAVFLLTYEELLQRRLGLYQHVTRLWPLQLVSKLVLEVTIVERSTITHLEVLPLRNSRTAPSSTHLKGAPLLPPSTLITEENHICKIKFNPTIIQQAKIARNGILGDFIIRYDVERELGIGDIQVLNGHFVHYFAPKDLPPVPKNVVFVIDSSASMMGTKLQQTKEALFSILKDLCPSDHFNIVSFSNRIRVLHQGKLLPVSPDNIRDAKKFIYLISPSGGTDINGAFQTSSSLLSNHLSNVSSQHRSVSFIIFLTDARATVGELQSPSILSSARTASEEQFCIFTIGLGSNVDSRLLEQLALENCGMMRQIPDEADAGIMFKRFYDEIGTPLLSDIHVAYSEDMVEYITQHRFTNYFNGSEIVIAGKLKNPSAGFLHVQVTASNSDKNIVLETDVPLRERQRETENSLKVADIGIIAEKYVEQIWGFLSVQDGLKSRLRRQGSRVREEITQRTTNLSLAHNFLTPLTRMVVENPEFFLERSAYSNAADSSAGWLVESGTGEAPQSLHRKFHGSGNPKTNPTKKSISLSKTSADGDPHFVVDFPLSKLTVCFNINGEPGDILRLVSDHKHSGVTVNGKLIGAPAPAGSHKQQRTYFSTITVVVDRPQRGYIEITPRKVILDGRDRLVLRCDTTVSVERDGLGVAIVRGSNITVTVQGNIGFVILIHHYKNPASYQTDHLGFYISNSNGLSENSHGLLGQFLYEQVSLLPLNAESTHVEPSPASSFTFTPSSGHLKGSAKSLKIKNRMVEVVRKFRKIYNGKHSVDCWFVRNNAAKLIDGQYENYVVSHLFDTDTGLQAGNM